MIRLKEILTESEVSKELWYHINHNISLEECVFRYGSPKYFTIINEARLLACEENIDFDNQTRALLETDLGKFGTYKGEEVALDFPLINQDFLNEAYYEVVADLGDKKTKENLDSFEEVQDFMDKMVKRNAISVNIIKFNKDKKQSIKYNWTGDKWEKISKSDINEFELNEAKKKKKDPPIGKPKRGGPKAYYVYVRDPKTKRIKKVTFGSGGLRAKINNPKARKAFAARHKCSTKTDRTKAGYWSCRLPRYAKQLGLSVKNPGGFW